MDTIWHVNLALFVGAALMIGGILSSLLSARFGAPLLFIFLSIGMLAGEDGPLGIVFNDYRLTYTIGSIALAVILFDGGLRTRLVVFQRSLLPAGILATLGVVATAGAIGLVASWLLGITLLEGFLVGAIVSSTDAAAVFYLLRTGGLQLKRRVGATLEIESGTNDPASAFLTILLVQLILAGNGDGYAGILQFLLTQILLGTAIGIGGGFVLVWALGNLRLPPGLRPLFVVGGAIAIFALTSLLSGSGFLAAYLAGLVLGNREARGFPAILSFHDAATWLAQIAMFLILGLLVTPSKLLDYFLPALAIAAFLIVVARPAAVFLCLLPFNFSLRERLFVSWVGLRGAVSIFLAAIPTLSAVPNADMYFDIAYVVVLASLLVQGWTIPWFAKRLKVALSETAPDVQRLEVDIPGQHSVELVGYPIVAESPVMLRSRQPDWLQTVCVIRDGRVISGEDARKFRPGDYGYFLVPIESVRRLDRLFAPSEAIHAHQPVESFSFSGELQLTEVAMAYGLPIPEGLANASIREAFMMAHGEETSLGDRLQLGPAALVVAEMDGDQVKTVTFEIDQDVARPSAQVGDRFNRGVGEIAGRTAKRISRLFSR